MNTARGYGKVKNTADVILLNGPSSSGKSTLSKALRELILKNSAQNCGIISIDDYLNTSPDRTIYEDDVFEISEDMYRSALDILEKGSCVIIDHVITSRRIYELLINTFSSYRIKTVRVFCSPEILRKRETERKDRCPGSADASERYLFPKEGYDLVIDTGIYSPTESAARIYDAFFL